MRTYTHLTDYLILLLLAVTSTSFAQAKLTTADMVNFRKNGDAYTTNGNCFRLTDAVNWSGGSIWHRDAIDLSGPFVMELNLVLGCKDDRGADGMVFIFHREANMTGYRGEGMGFAGLRPSLGIELDTWRNEHLGDPAQDHVAILRDGSPRHWHNLAGPVNLPNLEDCRPHRVFIKWRPEHHLLTVAIDGVERIRYRGDIVQEIFSGDPQVYWGVSAATGQFNNRQEICFEKLEFSMSTPLAQLLPSQIRQLKHNDGLRLDKIQFSAGQTSLNAATTAELDKLVRYLKNNEKYAIEIAAYTDSSGSETANRRLSQLRAETIKKYLIGKGVDHKRIYAFGYGESNPLASNATPEGRIKNRRVTFRVFRLIP